jgi:hypothetical protein
VLDHFGGSINSKYLLVTHEHINPEEGYEDYYNRDHVGNKKKTNVQKLNKKVFLSESSYHLSIPLSKLLYISIKTFLIRIHQKNENNS